MHLGRVTALLPNMDVQNKWVTIIPKDLLFKILWNNNFASLEYFTWEFKIKPEMENRGCREQMKNQPLDLFPKANFDFGNTSHVMKLPVDSLTCNSHRCSSIKYELKAKILLLQTLSTEDKRTTHLCIMHRSCTMIGPNS